MSEPPPAETARATERRGSGGWDRVLKDEQHLVSPGSEWRSDRWGVDWRTAAQAVGIEPVAEASQLPSVYP